VYLLEDSIVAAQDNGAVTDTAYIHNDVLRDILTKYTGDPIGCTSTSSYTAGYVAVKQYKYPLANTTWNRNRLHLVAFVHKSNGTTLDVIQARAAIVR
jgi:hypothetical protein